MQKEILTIKSIDSLVELNQHELISLEGGSFWEDLARLTGATAKCIWIFAKTAAEFQTSLPPNLKK